MGQFYSQCRQTWSEWHSHTGSVTSEGMPYHDAAVTPDAQHPTEAAAPVTASTQLADAGLQVTEPTGTPQPVIMPSSLPKHVTVKQEFKGQFGLESADISASQCVKFFNKDDIKCPLLNDDINVPRTFDHETFDCNGGELVSQDGIRITIPEGAIKDGDSVTFYTAADLRGPFVFPSQCQAADLVSPFYWIGVSRSYHFQNFIEVEFEHSAVATDSSHYQLLCCKDDDESYTMQPVDCDLELKVEGDASFCKFQTDHCCSYCLQHKNKDNTNINRIGAFYLKPKNFESLSSFTVEIWFSFTTKHCLKRIRELYTKKGMILDQHYSDLFEAPSDKSSKSYFQISYDGNINGWYLHHSRPTELIIETKQVNFYNSYTDSTELFLLEEHSLFPPRFFLYIENIEQERTTGLDTNITVTLYNSPEDKKSVKVIKCKVYNPVFTATQVSQPISIENSMPLIGNHCCDTNKPDFTDLIQFFDQIVHLWKEIAVYLSIPPERVVTIDLSNPSSM